MGGRTEEKQWNDETNSKKSLGADHGNLLCLEDHLFD
jgi:hypothetical protein